jgi:hypothetical protein
VLFSLHINDIQLFADDCVCYRVLDTIEDCEKLQTNINKLGEWSSNANNFWKDNCLYNGWCFCWWTFWIFEHLLSVYRYFHWNLLLVKLTLCLEGSNPDRSNSILLFESLDSWECVLPFLGAFSFVEPIEPNFALSSVCLFRGFCREDFQGFNQSEHVIGAGRHVAIPNET